MPNWTSNALTLKHTDPAMIDRAQHCEGLLMEFLPTPQELQDTSCSFFADEDKNREQLEIQARNMEKYGAADWYGWNIRNWGTKWDVQLENVVRVDEYTLTAAFDSAWSPPIEAYQKLEELGFEIDAKYYEPGMCFVGTYVTGEGENTIEYNAYDADSVREAIGEELDDYFGISEQLSYDAEEEDC
jgi:hypothetical protein